MKRESTISRVYGPNSADVESYFAQCFQNQETVLYDLGIDTPELEKTPEEGEIISLANFYINELRSRLGLHELHIPETNIHILPIDYELKAGGMNVDGFASSLHQAIVKKRNISNIGTASVIFHEMIHLSGYLAIRSDGNYPSIPRVGLTIINDATEYFRLLNESIVEELTREFLLRYQNNPLFKHEVAIVRNIVAKESQKFDPYNSLSEDLESNGLLFPEPNSNTEIYFRGFNYPTERVALNQLIDKLYHFNPDVFKSRKQVFNKFVTALFTGHIYELGKLIDGTFGKGTFRTIGEIEDTEELLAFIKSLQ